MIFRYAYPQRSDLTQQPPGSRTLVSTWSNIPGTCTVYLSMLACCLYQIGRASDMNVYISMYPYHCRGGRLDWALSFYSPRTAVPSRLAGQRKVYVHRPQVAHVSGALEHERSCSVYRAWRHPTNSKSTLFFTVCQKKVISIQDWNSAEISFYNKILSKFLSKLHEFVLKE